jgi:hypothetical protein
VGTEQKVRIQLLVKQTVLGEKVYTTMDLISANQNTSQQKYERWQEWKKETDQEMQVDDTVARYSLPVSVDDPVSSPSTSITHQ